jgi:SAM-dependent methyltransferase
MCAREGLEVEWLVGSAGDLPVAGGAQDVVLSLFGASHAEDPRAVAGELVRSVRPGGAICLTAWTGFMAELLRTADRRATRSERWARFETAYLHFFDFPGLDVRGSETRWQFTTRTEAIDELAAPATTIGAATRVRDALPALLERHADQTSDGGLTVRSTYATVFARRP